MYLATTVKKLWVVVSTLNSGKCTCGLEGGGHVEMKFYCRCVHINQNLCTQVSIKRFLKRNLADGGTAQCMNALADKVRKQES